MPHEKTKTSKQLYDHLADVKPMTQQEIKLLSSACDCEEEECTTNNDDKQNLADKLLGD